MKKILLFGFDALPEILTAAGIARRFDAEAVTVSREGCGLTLAALSQGQTAGGAGLPVGGKMMVLRTGAGTGRSAGSAARGGDRVPESRADAFQPKLDAGTAVSGTGTGTPGHGRKMT